MDETPAKKRAMDPVAPMNVYVFSKGPIRPGLKDPQVRFYCLVQGSNQELFIMSVFYDKLAETLKNLGWFTITDYQIGTYYEPFLGCTSQTKLRQVKTLTF